MSDSAPSPVAADGYVSPLANDPEYARLYAEEDLAAIMGETLARCMLAQGVTKTGLARRLRVSPARVRRLFSDGKDARLWAGALHVLGYKAELSVVDVATAQRPAPLTDVPRHLLIAGMQFHHALYDDTVRSLSTTNEYLQPIVDAALIWREKAVEQARRQGQLDVLRLGADTPFWLLDVFKRLLDIADHAHHVHNCDRHGYEVDRAAVDAGKDLLVKMLDILEAATAAEAGKDTQK